MCVLGPSVLSGRWKWTTERDPAVLQRSGQDTRTPASSPERENTRHCELSKHTHSQRVNRALIWGLMHVCDSALERTVTHEQNHITIAYQHKINV